jgi:hypothetical protein
MSSSRTGFYFFSAAKKSPALLDSPMYLFSWDCIFENKHWLNKQKTPPLLKNCCFPSLKTWP